jgi:hypothetical protein
MSVKKSDRKKTWYSSKGNTRSIALERHLIITEGTDTEPLYFESIKKLVNEQYKGGRVDRIKIDISGEGMNTLSLLEKAKSKVSYSAKQYSHVWIVYDKDDFPDDNFDNTANKCEATKACAKGSSKPEYHAIWSNPCFELWFLLHFDYVESEFNQHVCVDKLSEHLIKHGCGTYEKDREDMFDTLRDKLDIAIRNAKKLCSKHKDKPPSKASPCTKVYEIVTALELVAP